MCTVTVATYFMAGITKLRHSGLEWITSDTLRNLVAFDNLRKIELGDRYSTVGVALVQHPRLFVPLAAGSMLIELVAPLALGWRRIGIVWSALAWSFHLGVFVVMFILFHYPLSGVAFASFGRAERVAEFVRRRLLRIAR
jgi:hypothetical protein